MYAHTEGKHQQVAKIGFRKMRKPGKISLPEASLAQTCVEHPQVARLTTCRPYAFGGMPIYSATEVTAGSARLQGSSSPSFSFGATALKHCQVSFCHVTIGKGTQIEKCQQSMILRRRGAALVIDRAVLMYGHASRPSGTTETSTHACQTRPGARKRSRYY